MKTFKNYWQAGINILFPNQCLGCRTDIPYDHLSPLCALCWEKIVPFADPVCQKCGAPLPDGGRHCFSCKKNPPAFTKALSASIYAGPMKELIRSFKYKGKDFLACLLAGFLFKVWLRNEPFQDCEGLVPVPLHSAQERERGYNQSRLLALELQKIIQEYYLESGRTAPLVLNNLLIRKKNTSSQTLLSKAERAQNVAGAFALNQTQKLEYRSVLLIDDVSTTGATLNECAQLLRGAGVQNVYGLSLAKD